MLRIKNHLLRYFGLQRVGTYTDDVIEMITQELVSSVQARELSALIGPYGAGKSHLMRRVRQRIGDSVTWVRIRDMTPRSTSLNNVINGIILDLSDEPLRPNSEARARQAERLLGRHHAKGKPACVIIDDAHRLTESSLSGLKRLREAEFNSDSPLLSIVLVGWERLGGKLHRRQDIACRTSEVRLTEQEGYMTHAKRVAFLQALFRDAIAPDTRTTIATLCDRPASLISFVQEAMTRAYQAGYDVVDDRVVQPTPAELKDALGVSYRDIAEETKDMDTPISSTTAHRRTNEPRDDDETDALMGALNRIAERKQQSASPETVPA